METPSGETPIGKRLSALGRGFRENRVFAAATVLTLIWLGGVLAYAAGFFGLFESAILAPRRHGPGDRAFHPRRAGAGDAVLLRRASRAAGGGDQAGGVAPR